MTDDAPFHELLAPGIAADDVPELAPLRHARPLLTAFSTLFHGSEAEVLARLLVLREIGRDAQTTHWTPERLRQRFTYLDPVKLETVLRRLRGNGLLDIGHRGVIVRVVLGGIGTDFQNQRCLASVGCEHLVRNALVQRDRIRLAPHDFLHGATNVLQARQQATGDGVIHGDGEHPARRAKQATHANFFSEGHEGLQTT